MMRNIAIRILIFMLLMFTILPSGYCDLYSNCIFSYEFADVPRKNVVVRAIGDICYDRCNVECNAFSRTYNGEELNQDIIDKCQVQCRKGQLFAEYVREGFLTTRTGGNWIYKTSTEKAATKTHCSPGSGSIDSADFILYRSGIFVTADDNFTIDLIAPPGFEGNVVYLCGQQTTYLDVDRGGNPGVINSNNREVWEARNPFYFDTGIAPKDGDYLSIKYAGEYMYDCNNDCLACYGKPTCQCPGNTCSANPQDFNLMARSPKNPGAWNSGSNEIIPGGQLQLIAPPPPNSNQPDNGNYPEHSINSVQKYNENLTKEWKGLGPNIYKSFEPHYGKDAIHISYSGYLGVPLVRNDKDVLPSYNFDNISGGSSYSPRHAMLGLKHFDETGNYFDNQGGFYGEVSWKGCSQFRGQRLQYSTVPSGVTDLQVKIEDIEWIDLDVDDVMNPIELKLPANLQDGEIVLRVKPYNISDYGVYALDCDPTQDSQCTVNSNMMQDRYNEYNAFGQYYVSVTKSYGTLGVLNKVSDAIRNIREYFFGTDTSDGLMQFIYKALVSETAVMDIIRAVIIFYIAFTGFAFMAGLSPINQREGSIRLLKLGLVLMLISENSWDFFYNGFFKIFLEGMTEIIANIATPVYRPESEIRAKILADGANVFLIFDEPLRILFSSITWKKVLGLMFTNILGFLLAIVLALGCLITILVLIKALIIYITSLVVLAILVILSPIFITLILFGYTKQMFDNWIKQLIVYTLQPIFVFTAIALLLHLLIIGVQMALSFTICEVCNFGFAIPGVDDNFLCIIPGYKTLFGSHMPAQGIAMPPVANMGIILYLLIVAQSMYAFSSFASSLAILIGSGQFVGFDLATVASNFRSIGFITDSVASTVGLDSRSRGVSRRRG